MGKKKTLKTGGGTLETGTLETEKKTLKTGGEILEKEKKTAIALLSILMDRKGNFPNLIQTAFIVEFSSIIGSNDVNKISSFNTLQKQILSETLNKTTERIKELISEAIQDINSYNSTDLTSQEIHKQFYYGPGSSNLECFLNDAYIKPGILKLKSLYFTPDDLKQIIYVIDFNKKISDLKKLNLFENGLKKLPKEIGNLIYLEELNLMWNELEELPKEIGNLTNLEILNLDGNNLTTIPPEISQLINLKRLSLDGNNLTTIPKEILQLPQLQYLSLPKKCQDDPQIKEFIDKNSKIKVEFFG